MVLGLFGTIGNSELLIILVVALLFFGGRLPEVARSLGKSVNMFKKGLKDVEDDMNSSTPEPAPPKSLAPPAAPRAAAPAPTESREPHETPQG